ncbi:GntR family transcriptional regulator [Cohnella silvisoli]|uniref:GntR family transcriptional regulator n=1 Tax=Cohnella silvisoli TaxID=2873699 RepID=A0ABV1KR98_9BACL|nr:GntR family transcriptional regulator [Cohnella silvisoli]MCD9024495.1 GntR family transcriptional regulator [Cohnella silvisoli]
MQETLYEKIYNRIANDIRVQKLKPGDRVPSEKELADEYNVSRITTKKAMELLAQSGYIERIRGKGSYVTNEEASANDIFSPVREVGDSGSVSKLVGLLIPDMTDSFGLRLFRAIEEHCAAMGCHLLIRLTNDKREVEEAAIRDFVKLGVDGLIVFPVHGEHYNGDLLRLVLDSFPLVLVDRYFKGIAACSVSTDNRKAAQELTSYLLDKGHTDISFISTPAENTTTIEDRIQGYTSAIIQRGIVVRPDYIITNLHSTLPQSFHKMLVAVDQQVLGKFIDQNPKVKAFVTCEYYLAIVLHKVLLQKGKSVEDYEIVCFDSADQSWDVPMFTSIRQNEEEMGRMAVDFLDKQWNHEGVTLQNIVEHKIVYK